MFGYCISVQTCFVYVARASVLTLSGPLIIIATASAWSFLKLLTPSDIFGQVWSCLLDGPHLILRFFQDLIFTIFTKSCILQSSHFWTTYLDPDFGGKNGAHQVTNQPTNQPLVFSSIFRCWTWKWITVSNIWVPFAAPWKSPRRWWPCWLMQVGRATNNGNNGCWGCLQKTGIYVRHHHKKNEVKMIDVYDIMYSS